MEKIRIIGEACDLQGELERLGISPSSKKIKVIDFHSYVHYAIGFEDEYESELWLLVPDGWRPATRKVETEEQFAIAEALRIEFQKAQDAVAAEARQCGMVASEFAKAFPDHLVCQKFNELYRKMGYKADG